MFLICSRSIRRLCGIITRHGFAICMLFSLLLLFGHFVSAFSMNFWSDEAFSLQMIGHSYADMFRLTAADVHPPLYYVILKSGVGVLRALSGGTIPVIAAAKMMSLLPYAILLGLCATHVRRTMGSAVGGGCAMVLMLNPTCAEMATEIRMYSWSLFFVFLCYLAAVRITLGAGWRAWLVLGGAGLCAAYTHYFAGLAAGLFFLFLAVRSLRYSELRLPLLGVLVGAALLYLPWLQVLLGQVNAVRENYWITAASWRSLAWYVWYPFARVSMPRLCCLGVMVLVAALAAQCVILLRRRSEVVRPISVFACLLPLIVVALGVCLSLCLRPIFISRYLFPTLLCCWAGLLALLQVQDDRARRGSWLVIGGIGILYAVSLLVAQKTEWELHRDSAAFVKFAEQHPSAVYVSENSHLCMTSVTLYPARGIILRKRASGDGREPYHTPLQGIFHPPVTFAYELGAVRELLQQRQPVYLLLSSEASPASKAWIKVQRDAREAGLQLRPVSETRPVAFSTVTLYELSLAEGAAAGTGNDGEPRAVSD